MADAKPGESCRNDHFPNRFTCPNCYTDHERSVRDRAQFLTCECGARLRCEFELIESSVCTIADPDEDEEQD